MTYRVYSFVLSALLVCAACAAPVSAQDTPPPAAPAAPAAPASVPAAAAPASAGLYTAAQATLGTTLYKTHCAACHGGDLEGVVGPSLTGPSFHERAATKKLTPKALLDVIATTMPMTAPASLKADEYAAITAFILQRAGYPAGDAALVKGAAGLDALDLGVNPKAAAAGEGHQIAVAAPKGPTINASTGVYTAAQAVHGRQLYNETCIQCHGGELDGVEEAPPLAGQLFMSKWANLPVGALHAFIGRAMPPGNGGALGAVGEADVVAFILSKNNFPAGSTILPADPDSLGNIILK